jgi:regulator of protease activity HflC (stomatin/prohibitin superfamily)
MTTEKQARPFSGWILLLLAVTLFVGFVALFINQLFVPGALMVVFFVLIIPGFFTVEPNNAKVLVLFGKYEGTVIRDGFFWANPFLTKSKISLRLRNFNSEVLKVNDQRGNPVEIGIIVVWKVINTAQAIFDVDDYENFVRIQSEAAVRHLASIYPYDQGEDDEITLRGGSEQVSEALMIEIQDRLKKAGVLIEEARLSHLAYAPEIASAMLRRQQAEAIIAARRKIVHGAVSMVEMALKELEHLDIVNFDEERKAAMVSNLLVVLCGETEAQPVINTGTLHH